MYEKEVLAVVVGVLVSVLAVVAVNDLGNVCYTDSDCPQSCVVGKCVSSQEPLVLRLINWVESFQTNPGPSLDVAVTVKSVVPSIGAFFLVNLANIGIFVAAIVFIVILVLLVIAVKKSKEKIVEVVGSEKKVVSSVEDVTESQTVNKNVKIDSDEFDLALRIASYWRSLGASNLKVRWELNRQGISKEVISKVLQ